MNRIHYRTAPDSLRRGFSLWGCGCISPGSLAPLWAVLWACVGWVWISFYTSTTAADRPPFFFCPGVCCPGCAVFGVYLLDSGGGCCLWGGLSLFGCTVKRFVILLTAAQAVQPLRIVRRSCPGSDTPGGGTHRRPAYGHCPNV